ncbi:DUF4294 domain-containing protein [uncultured Prevotella sp.]|uniref:DUF4294 domain-containing protein n=1 Tax=uncultured Prevotella sp. TaxID=159272 RepID=UPI002615C681|nr:DUF4294 domain-containing protein [uncultured Prevotella sp.]
MYRSNRNIILLVVLLAFCAISARAQNNGSRRVNPEDREVDLNTPTLVPMVKVGKVLHDGDSIQYVELNTLYVYPQPVFTDERQRQAYNRLVANIKKVLPIAKEVNSIIIETYEFLQTLPNKKAKDEHMQRVEKCIRKEYTPRMKKLTYSQGKLLIKLVYRECNSSSYQLIQAFLGPIRAGFYQAFASLFGASLTKKYDAEGVDKYTERIVRQVEAGQL